MKSPIKETLLSLRRAWFGIGLLSFFVNLLMLTGPLYMLQIYDRVISSRSMSTLMALSCLMVLMYGFMMMLDFLRARLLVRMGNYVEKTLDNRTFHVWLRQGLEGPAAERRKPLSDLARIRQFLTGPAPTTFFDIPWTPVYIGVIFMFSVWLGVFAVIGTAILLTIAITAEIMSRKPQSAGQESQSKGENFSSQCHQNAEVIISMGMADDLATRWQDLKTGDRENNLHASDISGGASAFSKSFRMFLQSAILGLGAALAINGSFSPGSMIAGSLILGRALSPIQMVISHWRSFLQAKNSYRRLNLFYELTPDGRTGVPLPQPRGIIAVSNMSAGPPGSQLATLKNLNFGLQPGDGLCVIGPSGSGKSTLARLLVGAWMPQLGSVRIDGATFDQWSASRLGQHIGFLPQTISLFDGTIGENIARFQAHFNPTAVVNAAIAAGVHELILGLPNGYNTLVGEGGVVLSVGQTQRVGLARALYGNPTLIVLDEPNSNLDRDGDKALVAAITTLREQGKTVIVISHRRSIMKALNKVLVLRHGAQANFGLKEDVLPKKSSRSKSSGSKSSRSKSSKKQSKRSEIKPKMPALQPAPIFAQNSANASNTPPNPYLARLSQSA